MSDTIERASQFDDSPAGWARRWSVELAASRDALKDWWARGDKVIDRYLDERKSDEGARKRLNLFHGDVETKRALLYGNPPRVRCRRRHADADDDVARVSAEMLERILNTDIDRDGDGFVESLGLARDDRLLPGLGQVRARYTVEMEDQPEVPAQRGPCPTCRGAGQSMTMDGQGTECPTCQGEGEVELAPAVPAQQVKADEDVETDYVHWRDFLWSVGRTWDESYWVAFEAEMTRDALEERFGSVEWMKDRIDSVPLESKRKTDDDKKADDPWARACVWEIWNKDDKKVYWFVEGFDTVLDIKDDPLGLEGFFPCPRPMMANTTTRKQVPVPDFAIAQDLYNEIDDLYHRIWTLTDAAKVRWVYDQTNAPNLGRLLDSNENEGTPVDGWAAFQERGGLKGAIEFLPLADVANAIAVLSEKLREKIVLKDQVTGIADVMRGAASGGATATEQRIKARFGSTRIQAAQDEFARFTTDTQKLRAEIIARHWDVATIIDRSNIMRTPDGQYAQQAAELIKQDAAAYRIEVSSDTLSMTDFDALKGDRVEFLTATASFLAQIGQIAAAAPQAAPYLLEFLKYGISGFRGAAQLEGVLDRMVGAAQQAAKQAEMAAQQPKPPDPKVQAAQVGLETKKIEAGAKQMQAKTDMAKSAMDLQTKKVETQLDMQKMGMEMQRDRQKMAMDALEAQRGIVMHPDPGAPEA